MNAEKVSRDDLPVAKKPRELVFVTNDSNHFIYSLYCAMQTVQSETWQWRCFSCTSTYVILYSICCVLYVQNLWLEKTTWLEEKNMHRNAAYLWNGFCILSPLFARYLLCWMFAFQFSFLRRCFLILSFFICPDLSMNFSHLPEWYNNGNVIMFENHLLDVAAVARSMI